MKLLLLFSFYLVSISSFAQISNKGPWIINQGQNMDQFKGPKADSLKKKLQNYVQQKQSENNMLVKSTAG